jgi:RND family efflux transporter MFP subunit
VTARRPCAPCVALLVALLAVLALACGEAQPEADKAQPGGGAETPSAVDETPVHRIALGTVPVTITASGTIVARRVTEIAPEIQGRLVEVAVEVGDEVAEGEPLFRIDATPFETAADDARAGLALARAEASNAAAEAERIDRLAEKHAASEQRVDQLRTQAAVASARVEQAEALLARAERNLSLTIVRAPYAGSIVERRAHEGAMAGAGPVLVLQETGALEVVLDVPEAAAAVRESDRVELRVEGYARPLVTRVRSVSRRVDPDTRTYEVRAPVPNPDGLVKAGSYAQATVDASPGDAAPVAPREALLMRDGRTFVFRVEGDRVTRVRVELGRAGAAAAEVTSGLAAGDEVVVGDAVNRLGDGMRIVPRRSAPPVATTARPETGG